MKKQTLKPWQVWGNEDAIRQLRGYSAATAVKPKAPKPKKRKLKLKVLRGGKR
jgi:hypothetical protein